MKRRNIFITLSLVLSLGFSAALLALHHDTVAVHAAQEDEEVLETFGSTNYEVVEADDVNELRTYLGSQNSYYINMKANIYTDHNDHFLDVKSNKYLNMNGYVLYGTNPGVLHVTPSGNITVVNGQIKPFAQFALEGDIYYKSTIAVMEGMITLRDVTVIGTYRAISAYGGTINIRDGCSIDAGWRSYSMTEGSEYISMCFGLGGDVKLNISGGNITGQNAAYSWSVEHVAPGYQGDTLGANAKINISGGTIERFNPFFFQSKAASKNNFHIYGGKFNIHSLFSVQGSKRNDGFTKETMYQTMKNSINTKWADAYSDDGINLAYQYNGTTYASMADAYLSAAEIRYSYQKSQLSDAVQVNSIDDIPDGDLYNLWYTASVPGVGKVINIILNQTIALNSFLSFNIGASQNDKTLAVNEKVAIYTKYSHPDSYPYRGAQRHIYEWTIRNNTLGTSKVERGYGLYVFKSSNVGDFTISCKITATNKYGIETTKTTDEVHILVNTTISGAKPVIKFNDKGSDTSAITAVYDEVVTMKCTNVESLRCTEGARYSYQWYYGYSDKYSEATPISGASKSSYSHTTNYIGNRYFFLGIQAVKTSGSYDFFSEEVVSDPIVLTGKNLNQLIVRKDYADRTLALGTEELIQVSVIGDAEANDLTYQWYIENDNGTQSKIMDQNTTNIRYSGTQTPNLTVCRNDKVGVYKFYCYVTDRRGNVSLTSKSEACVLTYRDAGIPEITNQPRAGRFEESDQNITIRYLDYKAPDYNGSITFKWYKSTTAFDENETDPNPEYKEYSYTGKTVKEPTFTNPGVGIWYYYCEVINTVNGHTGIARTNYVEVMVYSHEHDITIELTSEMPEEIRCEVGDSITVSYEYDLHYKNSSVMSNYYGFGDIYCDELACGMTIAPEQVLVSDSNNVRHYKVSVTLELPTAGTYTLDGSIYGSSNNAPYYDSESLRGSFGNKGLLTNIICAPKDNCPDIINVTKTNNAEIIGNFDVGNTSYYIAYDSGIIANSNVYDENGASLGSLTEYDNFIKYELYVENASQSMVKVSESFNRNNLPTFNYQNFNNSLSGEDRYSDDYDGQLNAFIRIYYDDVREILDMTYDGGGVTHYKGLYVQTSQYQDSNTFQINIMGDCLHQDSRYERCNHDTGKVEVICYGCGQIVETMDLHLIDIAEQPAKCCDDGVAAHKGCEYCDRVFDNDGHEVNYNSLILEAKGHTYVKHEAKEPTCTEKGNIEYYECSECHEVFLLEEGHYHEVSLDDVLLNTRHVVSDSWSHNSEGHYHVCEECGQIVGNIEPHIDEDDNGLCDVCGRDLNAAAEMVHVTLVDGTFEDGSTEKDIEVGGIAYISAVNKEGYTFEGWYINGQKVSSDSIARIVITEACTIEARYTSNGGGGGDDEPVTPDKPKKKGCGGSLIATSIIVPSLLGLGILILIKKRKEK